MKLKDYLIASPTNQYQPWILSKTAMATFCVGIWVLRMLIPDFLAVSAPGLDAQDLMTRVNAERTNRFIPALITNGKLSAAAQIKSADMIARSYFAHVNPDGDYVWPVVEAQGYKPYQSLGENLAMDFTSAESLVAAWMNSPGHRNNILNEKFADQGMASVYGEYEPGHEAYLVTNIFGTLLKSTQPAPTPAPAPAPVAPAVTPAAQPSPSPVPPADPTPSPVPIPTPTPGPSPTPTAETPEEFVEGNQPENVPMEEPAEEPNEEDPTETTTAGASDGATPTASPPQASDSTTLFYLKIVLALFAGIYTLFLIIDSIIIHRAQVRRENIPSSPHSLMMFLVAAANFLTIWL